MASVFTYDPEPPRVSSPWLGPAAAPRISTPRSIGIANTRPSEILADYGVTRLEAEPQEGPTEYKLHLLLRQRRAYSSSRTDHVSPDAQQQQQQTVDRPFGSGSAHVLTQSNQSRQNRLEQLTTQLLWRLQQSSPYHANSGRDLILPKLPEATEALEPPARPGKLLAGLEESRGALYEIGVSDDGTFVGLTRDEMDESLTNLRAMAASLGCNVEVIRMVDVGVCDWNESSSTSEMCDSPDNDVLKHRKRESILPADAYESMKEGSFPKPLWVAEALITPDLSSRETIASVTGITDVSHKTPSSSSLSRASQEQNNAPVSEMTAQLRITLTGPTTSGKSTLLGTLSTATLDNGRGKSRLSLLKHRHEIVSGVTSSVAQELIGYKASGVINYASGNVTTWTDIHAATEGGRLVFVSDSAGHPRYRRTTVRGLIGWAPHWTVLCIPADENAPSGAGGTSSAQDILGAAGTGIDLAKAHLELCLKLEKPLVIVVTKLDLASKSSLRQTVSKILSAVKATGRTPFLLPPDPSKVVLESDLSTIPESDADTVHRLVTKLGDFGELISIVPIILTSAAKGIGIRLMHALLELLPISPAPTPHDLTGLALNPEQPACLFHIEDVFGVPASYEPIASSTGRVADSGSVVAGHLRFGKLSVGDIIVIGPFPTDGEEYDPPNSKSGARPSPDSFGTVFSHASATELRAASRNASAASVTKGEWHTAHIISIRNLRLTVHTLQAGQVGSIGIVFDLPDQDVSNGPFERPTPTAPRVRKGMVLAVPTQHMIHTGHTLQAASGCTASFEDSDINSVTPGSLVVLYIASVRASARVLSLTPHATETSSFDTKHEEMDDVFGLDDGLKKEEQEPEQIVFGSDDVTDVTFELLTNREWIELGSQVLVMPGGGYGLYNGSERGEKGIAGLEGFVGKVIEVAD